MTDCPGLIECTPTPVPAPVGLTPHEAQVMGEAFGQLFAIWMIAMFVLIIVVASAVVYMATRE